MVEEVASTVLPPALGRFARLNPDVTLEVVVDVSAALIGLVDRRQLDLALAKRPWGTSRGQLVWREQLVWAAADAFELAMGDTLPLALFRGSTVSRVAALEALRGTDQAWRIVYTSPSLTGVRAAALAGLAVTPLPRSAFCPGLRVLDQAYGMPALPELEFVIVMKPNPDAATAQMGNVLRGFGAGVKKEEMACDRSCGDPTIPFWPVIMTIGIAPRMRARRPVVKFSAPGPRGWHRVEVGQDETVLCVSKGHPMPKRAFGAGLKWMRMVVFDSSFLQRSVLDQLCRKPACSFAWCFNPISCR